MVKLLIKNMVCPRCEMVVRERLTAMGYAPMEVELGCAVLERDELSPTEWNAINEQLVAVGFELLPDKDDVLVEHIKLAVIRYARQDGGLIVKLSTALEQEIGVGYKLLAATFSRLEGRTVENYYISQRIEYVKELISYGELTLNEIADKTGYSSVAYLSKQFSQVVGMTITDYRQTGSRRAPLTEV